MDVNEQTIRKEMKKIVTPTIRKRMQKAILDFTGWKNMSVLYSTLFPGRMKNPERKRKILEIVQRYQKEEEKLLNEV